MMAKDTGGQAFPVHELVQTNGVYMNNILSGMTLRQWYAGQALAGIISNPESPAPDWNKCAEHAMALADVMIAEGNKP